MGAARDVNPVISVAAPIVGRVAELRLLQDALSHIAAVEGAPRPGPISPVALVGAAGTGKSRVVREVITSARSAGALVLVGRAVPSSGPTAYRPLSEALLAWRRVRVESPLDGAYGATLEQLLSPASAAFEPVSPLFVGEAVLRGLADTGRTMGVVLVLEDLHWADAETLAAVEYLCDNAGPSRLMLVLTCRAEESSPARELFSRLAARQSMVRLELGPLSREDSLELAGSLVGGPPSSALAVLLHERSEGVPLLVEELVAALRARGALVQSNGVVDVDAGASSVLPDSVAEAVAARLDRLTGSQRQLLQLAAILGRAIDWQRLVDVSGESEGEVLSALSRAADLALLAEDPEQAGVLRFRHALVRDAVELSAFAPERSRLAGQALDGLLGTAGPDGVSEEELALAVDLAARSGRRVLATRLAVRAAAMAFDRWALRTAEQWLAEARRFADTEAEIAQIDVESLRVAATVGRVDVVERVGRGLLAREGDLPARVILETRLRLAQAVLDDGRFVEGERHLEAAEPLLDIVDDQCVTTRYELYASAAALGMGDPDLAREHAARTVVLALPDPEQQDLVCAGELQRGRALLPDRSAARAAWEAGLRLAEDAGFRLWRARMLADMAPLEIEELTGDEGLDVAERSAHEAGAVELAQRVALLRAELSLLRGEFEDADEHLARAGLAAPGTVVARTTRTRHRELAAMLAAMRGDELDVGQLDDLGRTSAAVVRSALALSRSGIDSLDAPLDNLLDDPLGDVADDPLGDVAGDPLGDVAGDPRGDVAGDPRGEPLDFGAFSARYPLNPVFASVVAVVSQETGGSGKVPRAVAGFRTALAEHADDPQLAAAALVRAVDSLADAPWFAAMLTRRYAPVLVDAGAAASVRDLLRTAAGTLDALGLDGPADACRAVLRRAGVPVPRRMAAQDGVPDQLRAFGVTAREMDVLTLVSAGLTSREVAERLYLSPRTVEKHVERLLVKTGCVNRAALAALAAGAVT